jgi:putative SOS response-associated peptidase YedK
MCGRYVVTKATSTLLDSLMGDLPNLPDDYNVAPTDDIPIVRVRHGERELTPMHWGLVPSWAKTFDVKPQPINARLESIDSNGLFRRAFGRHRAIVPALGYYEWQTLAGQKQPWFVRAPEAGMAFAALYAAWPDPTKAENDPEKWRLSTTIVTREAKDASGRIHPRMPVCLTPETYDDWLGDRLDDEERLHLLERTSLEVAGTLIAYPVGKAVGNVNNDGPELIEPVEVPQPPEPLDLG